MNEHEELIKKDYKPYVRDNIIVYWNSEICQHAGKCTHGYPEVFNVERRPWIKLDNGEEKKIVEVIDKCPSGALKYILKDEKELWLK